MDKTNPVTVTKSKENVTMKIRVGDKKVKQVNSVVYLEGIIQGERISEKDIAKRIDMANKAFGSIAQILKNFSMSMKVGIRILKCCVRLRLLYGCQTWTLKKDIRKSMQQKCDF